MFLWFFLECIIYSLLKSTCDTIFRVFFLRIVLGLLAKSYSHVTTTTIKIQNSSITPRNSWLLHFYSTSAPTPRLGKHESVFCSYNHVFFRMSFNWNPMLYRLWNCLLSLCIVHEIHPCCGIPISLILFCLLLHSIPLCRYTIFIYSPAQRGLPP